MNKLIKPLVRNLLLPTVYALGVDHLLRSTAGKDYLILCYHGVDRESSLPYTGRHISSAVFERHLRYFRKHFEVVSLDLLYKMIEKGIKPDRPTIALTFDDGYENNCSVALPLLEKYQMPASFYISGICVEQPDYVIWADILDVIRVHRGEAGIQYQDWDFRPGPAGLYDIEGNKSLYDYIKEQPVGKRDEILEEIRGMYGFDELVKKHNIHYFKLMHSDQLRQMARSPLVEIGVHGYQHYNLANIPAFAAKNDIETAKALLEKTIQIPVHSIAFPDGNYDATVKAISQELGLKHLLAENYLLPEDREDPAILPRVSISGTTNYYSQILFINQQFRNLGI